MQTFLRSNLGLGLLLYVLALTILSSCSAASNPLSIDGMAEAQGWKKELPANSVVLFKVSDPEVACRGHKGALACEEHSPTISIITTRKNWCEEPAGLIAHELAHACGWRH